MENGVRPLPSEMKDATVDALRAVPEAGLFVMKNATNGYFFHPAIVGS